MLSRPVLLFDGRCAFCRRWVARLRAWDRAGRIETLDGALRQSRPDLPPISDVAMDRAMQLVLPDGRVVGGGAALREAMRFLPGGAPLRLVLSLPGIRTGVDAGYAWVAARRHRVGCGDSCGVGASGKP